MTDDVKFEYDTIYWFPLIKSIFTYLKFKGACMSVDYRPQDYATVNELVVEVNGVESSTVETMM